VLSHVVDFQPLGRAHRGAPSPLLSSSHVGSSSLALQKYSKLRPHKILGGYRVADIRVPQKYYFGNIPAKNIGPGIFEYSGYWLLVGSEGLADNLPCV